MKTNWNPFRVEPIDPSGAEAVLRLFGGKMIRAEEESDAFAMTDPLEEARALEQLIQTCREEAVPFLAILGPKRGKLYNLRYKDIKRILEAETGTPVFVIELHSRDPYEEGKEAAWLQLFETFAEKTEGMEGNRIGVIGELEEIESGEEQKPAWEKEHAIRYGIDGGIEQLKQAGSVQANIVTDPCAIKAAQYLSRRFGTPFRMMLHKNRVN